MQLWENTSGEVFSMDEVARAAGERVGNVALRGSGNATARDVINTESRGMAVEVRLGQSSGAVRWR